MIKLSPEIRNKLCELTWILDSGKEEDDIGHRESYRIVEDILSYDSGIDDGEELSVEESDKFLDIINSLDEDICDMLLDSEGQLTDEVEYYMSVKHQLSRILESKEN